jgi:hypothetical protein
MSSPGVQGRIYKSTQHRPKPTSAADYSKMARLAETYALESRTVCYVNRQPKLIAFPSKAATRQEIEIGPGRHAVQLTALKTSKRTGLNVQFGS